MEKDWCVDCWGIFADKFGTDLFYTEKEAKQYFKTIRKGLDSALYIITKNSILDKEDNTNSVCITKLSEL